MTLKLKQAMDRAVKAANKAPVAPIGMEIERRPHSRSYSVAAWVLGERGGAVKELSDCYLEDMPFLEGVAVEDGLGNHLAELTARLDRERALVTLKWLSRKVGHEALRVLCDEAMEAT